MFNRTQNNRSTIHIENLEPRQLLSGVQLDNSFGVHGVFTEPGTDLIREIAVQKDGKMLLADATQIRRLRVGGGTDRTYGENGTTGVPLIIQAIAVQNDGKAVVAGFIDESGDSELHFHYHLVVARLTPSGALDPTFGNEGIFSFKEQSGSYASSIAMRAGKIVIGGITKGGYPIIVVLNLDGTFDSGFVGGGIVVLGTKEDVTQVLIAKNGSITALQQVIGDGGGFRTSRVTATGEFDPTYSGDGISALVRSIGGVSRFINDNGSMIVFGLDETRNVPTSVRMTSHGKLDSSFGPSGLRDIPNSKFIFPNAIQAPDGTRYLYGQISATAATSDPVHIYVAKLTPDNRIDTSFANQGFLTISPHFEDDAFASTFVPQGNKLVIAAGAYSITVFAGVLIRVDSRDPVNESPSAAKMDGTTHCDFTIV